MAGGHPGDDFLDRVAEELDHRFKVMPRGKSNWPTAMARAGWSPGNVV